MNYLAVKPGQHVSAAVEFLVETAKRFGPSELTFNDIRLRATGKESVEDILKIWEAAANQTSSVDKKARP